MFIHGCFFYCHVYFLGCARRIHVWHKSYLLSTLPPKQVITYYMNIPKKIRCKSGYYYTLPVGMRLDVLWHAIFVFSSEHSDVTWVWHWICVQINQQYLTNLDFPSTKGFPVPFERKNKNYLFWGPFGSSEVAVRSESWEERTHYGFMGLITWMLGFFHASMLLLPDHWWSHEPFSDAKRLALPKRL